MAKTKKNETAPVQESKVELKVVGTPDDVKRFGEGDLVMLHLELRGQVFLDAPHGEMGTVVALQHSDNEYVYHLPVVQFGMPTNERRMVNPDYLIVVQKADGSNPEQQRFEEAQVATQKKFAEQQTESVDKAV